jgi:hypothetical protein
VNNDVIKEDKLNYVLVEGPDDAQVFYHLLRYYGLFDLKSAWHITYQSVKNYVAKCDGNDTHPCRAFEATL